VGGANARVGPMRSTGAVPVRRLNHAVLFVSDVDRSVAFYRDVLGFEPQPFDFPGGAFLRCGGSANDHDLGLFARAGRAAGAGPGLYHLAWEVETLRELAELRERLIRSDALTGEADHTATKAVYGHDPDGIEFELTWLVPDARVPEAMAGFVAPTLPLDLAAEFARYGADTPGGPRTDLAMWAGISPR